VNISSIRRNLKEIIYACFAVNMNLIHRRLASRSRKAKVSMAGIMNESAIGIVLAKILMDKQIGLALSANGFNPLSNP
jgi:hypothetical protein